MANNTGSQQPQWKLDYIIDHAPDCSAKQIAKSIDVGEGFVYAFCYSKGIELVKNSYHMERIKRFSDEVKKPFVRPKAVYDNESREDKINKLLSEGTGHD